MPEAPTSEDELVERARAISGRTLAELVYLSLACYCHAVDPERLEPISCERLVERLAEIKARPKRRVLAAALMRLSWVGHKLGL